MPNLGFMEIMILLVVVLLVFGAKRLPEIGSSIGKGMREFKRSLTEVNDSLNTPPEPPSRLFDGDASSGGTDTTTRSGEPKRLSQ